MNIASYNFLNFRSNHIMIKKLIDENHICFFVEHWLGNEEAYLFNELSGNHSIIFSSDFDNCEFEQMNRRGRPFGRRCWVISNELRVVEYSVLSQAVSKIIVEGDEVSKTTILGIWQPFDDNSYAKMALLQSSLSIISAEVQNINHDFLIVGDFNVDFNRKKLSILHLLIVWKEIVFMILLKSLI